MPRPEVLLLLVPPLLSPSLLLRLPLLAPLVALLFHNPRPNGELSPLHVDRQPLHLQVETRTLDGVQQMRRLRRNVAGDAQPLLDAVQVTGANVTVPDDDSSLALLKRNGMAGRHEETVRGGKVAGFVSPGIFGRHVEGGRGGREAIFVAAIGFEDNLRLQALTGLHLGENPHPNFHTSRPEKGRRPKGAAFPGPSVGDESPQFLL